MDLCGRCHRPVKSITDPCPNCGYVAKGRGIAGKIIALVLGVIILLYILHITGVINLPL
jgi:hypothetical protein